MALNQMEGGGVALDGASGPLQFNARGDLIAEPGQFEYWCINATPMITTTCCLPTGAMCAGMPMQCCGNPCDMTTGLCP
jgi:hypothetical protein